MMPRGRGGAEKSAEPGCDMPTGRAPDCLEVVAFTGWAHGSACRPPRRLASLAQRMWKEAMTRAGAGKALLSTGERSTRMLTFEPGPVLS